MAWPPTIPPNDRANATPTVDAHASDHNAVSNALAAIIARMAPLFYVEGTANVNVTALTAAGANTILTAPATVFDGSPVWIEWTCPFAITPGVANAQIYTSLWDGSTDLGYMTGTQTGASTPGGGAFMARRRLTPSAGTHTFSVRAFVAPSGTGVLTGGPGSTAAAWNPMTLSARYA